MECERGFIVIEVQNKAGDVFWPLMQMCIRDRVHIDYEEVIEDFESIPYEAFKELTLSWIDEKWVKQ